MLVSECPGWVCYAEKTTPQVLPLLSTAKSPQQCLGTLVKAVLAPASGLRPGQVCVVAVMPCYDKKLEASRKDFLHAEWGEAPEVDMVLTAGEVGELVREYGPGEEEGCLAGGGGEGGGEEGPANGPNEGGNVMDLEGAEAMLGRNGGLVPSTGGRGWEVGSGGYAEHVFRGAAWELFGVRVGPGPLAYREGRNADYKEAVLEVEGQEVLRVALAYGFRNIQGVVNKLRRGRGGLHLVEVMACPSGCVNGGGMLRGPASEGTARARERIKNVRESLLQTQEAEAEGGGEDGGEGGGEGGGKRVAAWVYGEVAREGPLGPAALRLFHTRFHAVPKLEAVNPSVIKW
jgi:iron only hydrogenase large subunit-like protein